MVVISLALLSSVCTILDRVPSKRYTCGYSVHDQHGFSFYFIFSFCTRDGYPSSTEQGRKKGKTLLAVGRAYCLCLCPASAAKQRPRRMLHSCTHPGRGFVPALVSCRPQRSIGHRHSFEKLWRPIDTSIQAGLDLTFSFFQSLRTLGS